MLGSERSTGAGPILGSLLVLLLLGAAAPAEASAQNRDFLFGTPRATFTFRAGLHMPRAASGDGTQSLWDLTREELTVDTRDLAGASIGGDLAIRATTRLDVLLSVGYTNAKTRSEFREWVDQDDLPIEQTTEFSIRPITVGVKAYLKDRGRAIGRFAWVPETWNPYVGVAGGIVSYRFAQHGDFIDYETLEIFGDRFYSRDRGATIQLSSGMDVAVNGRVLLVGEARYGFASAPLSADFVGFPDLDLAGLQVTFGIGFRL
ncbi:MAG: hypothetical protein OXU74_07880 [Gemmatimonadota bacterium]|nr:hypothetical protein [Gemmatimonadota bacterium]